MQQSPQEILHILSATNAYLVTLVWPHANTVPLPSRIMRWLNASWACCKAMSWFSRSADQGEAGAVSGRTMRKPAGDIAKRRTKATHARRPIWACCIRTG